MRHPLEVDEQKVVVRYCESVGHKITAIPNETGGSKEARRRASRMVAEGLRKGLCDLFIIVDGTAIFIEMKRVAGSVTSKEQQAWVDAINETQVPAFICKGATEAIEIIQSFEKKKRGTIF